MDVRYKKITKWHKSKVEKEETSHHDYYVPWTKSGINSILGNAPKKYTSRYYQPKVGHGAIGTILARIGVIENPQYWCCKETVQSVEYLYTKCQKW